MRIKPKRIDVRSYCFAAAEGVSTVRVAASRRTVLVNATDQTGNAVSHELSLPHFASVLVEVIEKSKQQNLS